MRRRAGCNGVRWRLRKNASTIHKSSRAAENVLDLFGGSASTLITAEQTGRRAFLMELDRLHGDVFTQRCEKFTVRKAEWHNRKQTVLCPEQR